VFDKRFCWITAIAALALWRAIVIAAAVAASPTVFVPDTTFRGSSLTGWHTLGPAQWRAESSELIANAGQGGGWLILDKSYQDVGFFASFRCAGGCKAGVLLRAEKTPQGMKGVYMSLTEGDVAAYRVTLDAQGQELSRERLRSAGGQSRVASPAPQGAAGGGGGGRGAGGRGTGGRSGLPPGLTLPIVQPQGGYRTGDWNQIEIILDANIMRPFLNDGGSGNMGGVAEDQFGRYGAIALYAGGPGEVRFKAVAYKDLSAKVLPQEQVSRYFRMQRIDDFYYSWGAAAADINRDGILDVITGPYYYLGPDYTLRREIYLARTVNPSTEYPNDSMQTFAYDFTGDGWPDVLDMGAIGQPLHLYVNPRGEKRRWDKYDVIPQVNKEVSLLKDIDGDGKPEYVYGGGGYLRYAKPDPGNPTGPWIVHTISEQGPWGAGHGLGVGDINGDGRMDIVDAYGWFEQPPPGNKQELWTYHPVAFGRWTGHASPGGAEMGVYDVNGDGLNDVVTVLQAHGFGLAWFEQKRDAAGTISFVQHIIADDFSTRNAGGVTVSEMHGTAFADVDGDGIPDVLVGKRYWSHLDNYSDPDAYGPPVLYWYRTARNPKAPGGVEFVPDLIHNRSGAGNAVLAVDLNGDGAIDIITTTDRGTFIFWGKPNARSRARSGSK
jgi:hypothetical protein